MRRTRQWEKKKLQLHERQVDAASVTRTRTALNDGMYRRQRQAAEEHIAEVTCRHASLNLRTGKYCFPRGKQQEVFSEYASGTYSDLNVGFDRVRDRIYRMLAARRIDDEKLLEMTRNVEEDTNDVSLRFFNLLWESRWV